MPLEQAHTLHQSRLDTLRPQLTNWLKGRERVTLEIGCGHGHFLTAYAQAHPEEFCLGVDLLPDRLARAGRKSQRLGLENIAWTQAEAGLLLEALPDETRFTGAIFILFPDPWPKRRHWKHRIMRPDFLSALARRSGAGARLCFRTDHGPYFLAATEVLRTHPDWRLAPEIPWPFEEPTVFQSRADNFQSWVAIRR
jgi:tRNA (guanine-N7-)-methyltransferase